MKMKEKVIKAFALLITVSLLVGTLAACGGNSNSAGDNSNSSTAPSETTPVSSAAPDDVTDPEPQAEAPENFVYGADSESTSLDPYSSMDSIASEFVLRGVYEPLWNMLSDGSVEYCLATGYEWTGDLELTITLREGVTYHNGDPFTSEDVLFSLNRLAATNRTASKLACLDLENCTAPDDSTVVLAFNNYSASFISDIGAFHMAMLDKEWAEEVGDDGIAAEENGTGAYVLSAWNKGVSYELSTYDGYWGDAPAYQNITVKFYADETTRYLDFTTGNLDAIYLTDGANIQDVQNGAVSGATLVQQSANKDFYLQLNLNESDKFDDINVRKAIFHAIDVEAIVESFGQGTVKVSDSLLPSSNWAYVSQGLYDYDPELARQELAEAGVTDLSFTLVITSSALDDNIAVAIQSYLNAVGITMEIDSGDPSTQIAKLIAGGVESTIGKTSGVDPSTYTAKLTPTSDDAMFRLTDPDLLDLLDKASLSRDESERAELFAELQQAYAEGYYALPLYESTLSYAVSDTIGGWQEGLDSSSTPNPASLYYAG